MNTHSVSFWMVGLGAGVLALAVGCATSPKVVSQDLYSQLDLKDSEIRRLNAELDSREMALKTEAEVEPAAVSMGAGDDGGLLPPNAQPGECYARVFVPATYRTVEERVLLQEGGERVEMVPAEYEWVEETVVVKEASERIEVVPATYELREEQVLVTPASTRMEQVPAEYVWTEEKVLVSPAHTEWKKGRGPIEQVDNGTGEIMCLVEVPAEYKTLRKKVLKTPASSRTVDIPAEYTTVTKNVLVQPATTRRVTIPAETKSVRVQKLVRPEQQRSIPVQPEYQTVTRQVVDNPGGIGWRRVLCETNLSGDIIRQIQQALLEKGFDPGPIDGIIGPQTQTAVQTYQGVEGMAVGGLTFETMAGLGVKVQSVTAAATP